MPFTPNLARRVLVLFLGTSLNLACGSQGRNSRALPPSNKPRLVVSVIYDQLGTWVLAKHFEHLEETGAIKQTLRGGRHVLRARYPYAITFTAPGHAATNTGTWPAVNGIGSNRLWDRQRQARISTMDDGEFAVLEREHGFASPARLRVNTISDALHEQTEGRAVIASIAMKDRSAIMPGGHHPDLCVWFDARAEGFTTSRFYAEALPAWLSEFRTQNPWRERFAQGWFPSNEIRFDDLGADDQSGEGAYGFDSTFPHETEGLDYEAFLAVPQSSEYLIELADRVIQELPFGQDDIPDLLSLSIAGTDYVGHGFGPESWEYRDHFVKADAALGAFLTRISERFEVSVLISADHGVAPLVERSRERGHEVAVRLMSEREQPRLEAHLDERFGARDWVAAWVQPYVYFNSEVLSLPNYDEVVLETERFLQTQPGIFRALDVRRAAALLASNEPIDLALGRSIPPEVWGNVMVVPSEWSVAEEESESETGTSHGSPWNYDTDVPVIYRGYNVEPGVSEEVFTQSSVAATIARLLGVQPPSTANQESLPGFR